MTKLHIDHSVLKVYGRLMAYAAPYWRRYLLAIIGMTIYAFTQAAFAALVKPLLDSGFVLHDPRSTGLIPLEVVVLFLLRGLADFLGAYNISWVGRSIIKRLRKETFGRLLQLPSSYYDISSSGMLVSKLTYNI